MRPQFVELAEVGRVQAHLIGGRRRDRHRPALADLLLLKDQRFLVRLFVTGLIHQIRRTL